MTTAARPTFDTARGGTQRGEGNLSVLSKQYSSRDLPAHTKIKTRQTGQNTTEELRGRDFKRDLIEREKNIRDRSKRSTGGDSHSSSKRARIEPKSTVELDADDAVDDDDEDSDDSDDEDDTAELLAELHRIKRDRAEEIMKKEQEKRQEEERIRTENLLSGNPLLNNQPSDFRVNRRWDDDVVFKNCAKDDDTNKNKGFINDTIRSEFHKRFMDKYVK